MLSCLPHITLCHEQQPLQPAGTQAARIQPQYSLQEYSLQ
jgi:hypothetical protein